MLLLYETSAGWHPIMSYLAFLGIGLNALIYKVLGFAYQVFFAISSARLLREESYIEMANKIYLVIGVISLFLVAYGLLHAIINPDSASGKGDTAVNNMISKIITAVVLIAFVPTLFNYAYKIQEVVLEDNVIGNIMLHGDTSSNKDIAKSGYRFANSVFMYFFLPTDGDETDCLDTSEENFKDCLNKVETEEGVFETGTLLGNTYEEVNNTGKFSKYSKFAENVANGQIDFDFIVQLFVGCFITYIFVSFCIDMGLRAAKLAYYQIIAPIPILTIIIPGQKKIFDNWKKSTLSTFAEVFIRIMVVYFVLFLIKSLPNVTDNFWSGAIGEELGTGVKVFARIFAIIGLLMFMKQAPKLLGDMFGLQGGSFKLGIGDKLREATDLSSVPIAGRVQGAITGAAGAGWTAAVNPGGNVRKGLKTGMYKGFKSKGNQFATQRQQYYAKELDLKGTAGWLGGRNLLDKKIAESSRQAKNAYKSGNFERVKKFQNSPEWRDTYDKYYNNVVGALNDNINKVKNKIVVEEDAYNNAENGIKQKIDIAKQNKQELDAAKLSYANQSNMFDIQKKAKKAAIQKDYDEAVAKKDISAQLDAQKRLNELDAMKYHNPTLENKIKELSSKNHNVEALEAQLSQVQLQRKNDQSLEMLNNSLTEYNNKLNAVNKEHDYITTGQLEIDGKMVERSYKTEEEFVKRYGGFTDALTKADAEFKKTSPIYKDVSDTHSKYMTETSVNQFVNSEEGQKAIAVREIAEKNLNSNSGGGSSSSGSGDKK